MSFSRNFYTWKCTFEIYVIRGMLKIVLSTFKRRFFEMKEFEISYRGLFWRDIEPSSPSSCWELSTRNSTGSKVLVYIPREGKIAKEDPRFEPSHDPSAISEDASVEDAILPRAWERSSPTVKFCWSGIRASGFRRKKP